ncbi:MAG: TniQ family protein [Nitrosomonadales bacterium]|nr:TniQ family protein [Nitrosomonadales bacterium]
MLTRPSPYPEELDRGYLGRVMRRNGSATKKDAVTLMSIWAGVADKSRREMSCLELLSKVAGTDVPIFVRQHSLLPFRRGITSYQPDLLHGGEQQRSMLWSTGMQLARTGAYFCAECVREDQEFHGQSYWRREHQIPGMLWCSKHATPLKYTEDESAFLLPPAVQLQHCQSVDEQWVKQAFNNKSIQRYNEICSNLLDTRKPFDVKHVSVTLKEKASAQGFQTHGGKVKSPLLSDAIVNAFGRKWLATVLPALTDKPEGMHLSQMDGVLYLKTSASSVSAYVLAFAVLYESVYMALNALQSSAASTSISRQPSAQFTRDELLDAYIQERGNYSTIASSLSVSKPTLALKLATIGLPNLIQKANQSVFKAVFAFYVEKQSLQASAEKGNISIGAMEDLIRNASCDLTRALQAMQRPSGRGTGVRRARQLTPGEASSATGPVATKFSPKIRREQLRAQELRARAEEECRA